MAEASIARREEAALEPIHQNALERAVSELLRVPPPPELPLSARSSPTPESAREPALEPNPEAGPSVRRFRSARGYWRYRLFQWLVRQVQAVLGILFGFYLLDRLPFLRMDVLPDLVKLFLPTQIQDFGSLLEWIAVVSYVLFLPVSFLRALLDYRFRWYLLTDRSLRIREGLWRIRDQTMSFVNIQNLTVRQGPVQRFFGIADLVVRTAGGGSEGEEVDDDKMGSNLHLGVFQGIDNAEELKSLIRRRQKRLAQGEPVDGRPSPEATPEPMPDPAFAPPAAQVQAVAAGATSEESPPTLAAAGRALLAEARALRAALATPPKG